MSNLVLVLITGLGLGGLYFLLASGLSLIYGLMGILNMAHGVFFAVGGFTAWLVMTNTTVVEDLVLRFVIAVLSAAVVGTVIGVLVERVLIARTYDNHLSQILLTIGLSFTMVAILGGIFSYNTQPMIQPEWFVNTTSILGAHIPNSQLLVLAVAVVLLVLLLLFISKTRYGLIIRAGVENRRMVELLGINVDRSFTLVFAVGGVLAAVGGALGSVFLNGVNPQMGTRELIFAFIVVIIGGLGSISGTAVAAAVVAVCQSLANFYLAAGMGDIVVMLMLAIVLLVRPQGLLGKVAAT